jgi:CheY-like chemotaxis protein
MPLILIVEDDPNYQRILGYILRKAGYEIRIAGNGAEGLTALAEVPVDLAIVDMAMPVLDGLTMLRAMHANPPTSHIPVIMLTASGDDQVRQAAELEKVNKFLTKPTSSRLVLELVHQILGEKV